MKINGYPREEKLKNKKDISLLFEQGKRFSHKELSILSLKKEGLESPKISVSVSKRLFKKAVERNRIKRLLRESYRLNKELFLEAFGKNSLNMIFYRSSQMPTHLHDVQNILIKICKENQTH